MLSLTLMVPENELGKKLGIVFQDSVLDKPLTVRVLSEDILI